MFKNDNKPSSVEDLSSLAVSSLKERKSRSRTDSLSSDKGIYLYTCIYEYMYTYMYIYIYIYMCVYICIFTYRYMY
jgi:hypothetical protein